MFALPYLASLILAHSPYPSVVYLRADPDGVGTGWVVDAEKKRILTCRHVVGEQTKLEVFFPTFRDGRLLADASDYLGRRAKLREAGALVTGKVIRTSDELDLALIEVPSLPAGTRALPLADNRVSLGQSVRSIGQRSDVDTLWNSTTGTVRQSGRLTDGYYWQGKKLAGDLPSLVLQSPIEEGDSGGPVLNERGEVVGMISALRRRVPLAAVGPDTTAIRIFLERVESPAKREVGIADAIARNTVWFRPSATDVRCAGVVIDRERRYVLTSAAGVGPFDRIGMAFPVLGKSGEIVGEASAYKDGIELHLAKRWHTGTVLHRDVRRDLALVKLDSLPDGVNGLSLGVADPAITDRAIAFSHPTGLEFAFAASSGTLRQRGHVALARAGTFPKPEVNLFQLPATGTSPGGPICNERGQLLGVQAAKDAPLQQAYAASLAEVRTFLDEAPGAILLQNSTEYWNELNSVSKIAGWYTASDANDFEMALRHYSACVPALLARANRNAVQLDWPAVRADCDEILLKHPQHRAALLLRVRARMEAKDFRPALGDLQRWLDVVPGDIAFRELLLKCFADTGEPGKAADERKKIARLKAVPK